jgi:hypothetical protein
MFELLLTPFPAGVIDSLAAMVEIRACFPCPYADRVESLRFHSQVGALGLSSCFTALFAKLIASVKVRTGCIETVLDC